MPVGRYTKQVLDRLDLWDSLQGSLVLSSDVRQVLTHVELGNVDAGIVYASDVLRSEKVTILTTADLGGMTQLCIRAQLFQIQLILMKRELFLAFLTSDHGQELLRKYGFK